MSAIRTVAFACAFAAVPSLSPGQAALHHASAPPRVGSVSGDVYLVTQGGDVKRVAANDVELLLGDSARAALAHCTASRHAADSLSAAIDSLDKLQWRATEDRSMTTSDYLSISAKKDTATTARDDLERRVAKAVRLTAIGGEVAVAHSDVNGHYAFEGVKPGAYAVWAETTIGDNLYTWLTPVAVAPGQVLRQDLDNASVNGVYCGFVVRAWWLR